jgi:hypothetical protein
LPLLDFLLVVATAGNELDRIDILLPPWLLAVRSTLEGRGEMPVRAE